MSGTDKIKQQVEENPVIIYMKGTPKFPQCGFSMRAAQAMMQCEVPFAYINILEDIEVYENLPHFANWPTFPQIYIKGELIGGCDITLELFANGELKKMMEAATQEAA
ncbi:MAG: Grx4 family monothiol glutaredoxin [Thiotrichaceae bacterium]|nr:Grx4 family monothiol glutaredoxin [Thiotrichaceae bacterium]